MEANKTTEAKRKFWSWRMLLVAVTAIAAIALLAGLLVAFSAPKNELLTKMPTQQSKLRFLGPLRQPVSDAWRKFRAAWLKPPTTVKVGFRSISNPAAFASEMGTPILTNQAGVSVWILDPKRTKSVLRRSDSFSSKSNHTLSEGGTGAELVKRHEVMLRLTMPSNDSTSFDVFAMPGAFRSASGARSATFKDAPKNHPAFAPFGAQVTIPQGSSVLLLGPTTDFDPSARFGLLLIPE